MGWVLCACRAQRLLRDIGGHLAFIPPTLVQNGSSFTKSSDCQQDLPLYNHAGMLSQDLRICSAKTNSLPERMVELAQFMVEQKYWGQGDRRLMQAWVSDLRAARYPFPSIVSRQAQSNQGAAASTSPPPSDGWRPGTFAFPSRWCMSRETVLVVNINTVSGFHANVTHLLYAAYRPYFREVYFTGEAPETGDLIHHQFVLCHATNRRTSSFMPGHFAYVCLSEVIAHASSKFATRGMGYFYINDDVTFSPCMVLRLNKTRIWYDSTNVLNYDEAQRLAAEPNLVLQRPGDLPINISNVLNNSAWHFGRDYSNGAMPGSLANHTHNALVSAYGWMANQVKKRLADPQHEGLRMFGIGQADFFYIPSDLAHAYSVWARHMRAYHVISEVAVPNILGLIGNNRDDYEIVPTAMLWGSERELLVTRAKEIMPLQRSLSLHAICNVLGGAYKSFQGNVTPVVCQQAADELQFAEDNEKGTAAFAVHPTKLSNEHLRQHWGLWWQSQHCMSRSP
eukprot:GHUV01013002.1.p1 GENE.GHUV01013002.1~~GHUV01013002.1.p1  ORF type:complete len:509 (+),score=57.15 GHUV01013002.1:1042-2568(+)